MSGSIWSFGELCCPSQQDSSPLKAMVGLPPQGLDTLHLSWGPGKVPQNDLILKGWTICSFQLVRINLTGCCPPGTQFSLQISKFSLYRTCLPPAALIPIPGSHWKQRIALASIHMEKYFRYSSVFLYLVAWSGMSSSWGLHLSLFGCH